MGGQRKAKMDKSSIGQKAERIKSKADKTPKRGNILIHQRYQGVRFHDHMIQVWTINVLAMRSRGQTEKSQNGQKQHRTKGPKDKIKSGQNPQRGNILIHQRYQGVRSHDHMIQVWTINVLAMRSRGRTEKSQNGQK